MPASHPSACVEGALRLKGLAYERVDLVPILHRPLQRVRFGQPTVPGVELDGERIVGSRRILRRLDALEPHPPLYPGDPDARARVEEVEAWGEETLQPLARRVSLGLARRRPGAVRSYSEGAGLPLPSALVALGAPVVAAISSRLHGATASAVQADLQALPGHLAWLDRQVGEGVLGGEIPNAADLQVGSSLQLLETFGDLEPVIAGRRCAGLGQGFLPALAGSTPAGAAPAEWLPSRDV
ncbi:MAG: glutathione S-transferase [Actinomycetota bacterium]|nr:glutathione S-transferase [Actinomycetota bacterium]